jgi:hypothetical protein
MEDSSLYTSKFIWPKNRLGQTNFEQNHLCQEKIRKTKNRRQEIFKSFYSAQNIPPLTRHRFGQMIQNSFLKILTKSSRKQKKSGM